MIRIKLIGKNGVFLKSGTGDYPAVFGTTKSGDLNIAQ